MHVATSRRERTTSTVVGTPGGSVLRRRPGVGPGRAGGLAAALAAGDRRPAAGFATHAHHDHLLWHPRPRGRPAVGDRDDGPRWPPSTAPNSSRRSAPTGRRNSPHWSAPCSLRPGARRRRAARRGGRARRRTPPDMRRCGCPAARVLLAGDMLSDVELPLPFDPDDVPAYLAGLDALAPYVAAAARAGARPRHPERAALDRLDADRRYLDALLAGGDPPDPRRGTPGMAAVHEPAATTSFAAADHRRDHPASAPRRDEGAQAGGVEQVARARRSRRCGRSGTRPARGAARSSAIPCSRAHASR